MAEALQTQKNIAAARNEVLSFGWTNCVNDSRPINYTTAYQRAEDSL